MNLESLHSGIKSISDHFVFKVGTVTLINIWKDHWIPGFRPHDLEPFHSSAKSDRRPIFVSELLLNNTSCNVQLLSYLFPPIIVKEILKIRPSDEEDHKVWPKKNFSTKDLYLKLSANSPCNTILPSTYQSIPDLTWNKLWKSPFPQKIKIFL
ncbi:hypothetical protein LIER_39035 [Lithospermum erythrorhizon]|uniref:Maturase K n=1 Tax=Lithospermum erythrorhizon TaxID=34254 RepID=A0AAV3Q8M8_LITER